MTDLLESQQTKQPSMFPEDNVKNFREAPTQQSFVEQPSMFSEDKTSTQQIPVEESPIEEEIKETDDDFIDDDFTPRAPDFSEEAKQERARATQEQEEELAKEFGTYTKKFSQDGIDMFNIIPNREERGGLSRDQWFRRNIIPSIKESPIANVVFRSTGVTGWDALSGLLLLMGGTKGITVDAAREIYRGVDKIGELTGIEALQNTEAKIEYNTDELADGISEVIEGLEMFPGFAQIGGLSGQMRKVGKELKKQAKIDKMTPAQKSKAVAKQMEQILKEEGRGDKRRLNFTAGAARLAEAEVSMVAIARANAEAEKASDLGEQMLKDFEVITGKKITSEITIPGETKIVDGKKVTGLGKTKLVYNPERARKAGLEINEEIMAREVGIDPETKKSKSILPEEVIMEREGVDIAGVTTPLTKGRVATEGEEILLTTGKSDLVEPILKPESFNKIVAVASDLKKRNPKAFDNNETVIDNLLKLTANQELLPSEELQKILIKYGLSFEDYTLAIIGTGSRAGQVLQKLSQIKRARPSSEMDLLSAKAIEETNGKIRNFVMRAENIRRGGLVSQLATASRNYSSAVIRAPLEGLGNVMDTSMYALQNEGVMAGARALVDRQNWNGSFKHFNYMFSRPDIAKDYTDYILDRPELAQYFDSIFNNLNEIQKATGRGDPTKVLGGKWVDNTLGELEDVVGALNIPNRFQEYLVRRGVFFGELERLTKREYDFDLQEVLQQGRIKELLNNSPDLIPTNKKSFVELVADSTTKALDVTYAKQPEVQMFRSISSFITRNGLTVLMPFPRFMFNSMELMGNYAAGASIPMTKKVMSFLPNADKNLGKLTGKDRQRISRNLLGMATSLAAYQYIKSEDAPEDLKLIRIGEGIVTDTSPFFPMRQFLTFGKLLQQFVDGGVDGLAGWLGEKENLTDFYQTFTGTNFRVGAGFDILDELAGIAQSTDFNSSEAGQRFLGRVIGSYLSSWAVPAAQIIDTQRAFGERGTEYRDAAEDPVLGRPFLSGVGKEIARPFKARGISLSPEEEAALPKREFLFQEDARRVEPLWKVLFGINLRTADSEEGNYLRSIGFSDWDLGSKSNVPSIRNFENKYLRELVVPLANIVQGYEESFAEEYDNSNEALKDSITKKLYIKTKSANLFNKLYRRNRQIVNSLRKSEELSNPYINAMLTYRRASKTARKEAMVRFIQREGREPDGSNVEDLQLLGTIASVIQ